MKKTMETLRADSLYTDSLVLHGNGKLLDYDDQETGISYRYAQFNTRAVIDCPFRSAGCERVCYATKGNHCFPSVKKSREHSFSESKRNDFADAMTYTIKVEKLSKRYKDSVMLIRLHESGDFYSMQYLKKWVKIIGSLDEIDGVKVIFYTKSFPFFMMLDKSERDILNHAMKTGKLSMNFSLDDTTSIEQKNAYIKCIALYPQANTYYCTEDTETVQHDNTCDCADCAKCGICNNCNGTKTVVKIHSASENDMEEYRKNIK